jgi:glycosyltransferase involved in cell wall biosynthesis
VKTTVVIPVFNEAKSLPILLALLNEVNSHDTLFLLVDNGSTDPEVKALLKSGAEGWMSIRTETNLGFGGGILFGIAAAETEFVGWMPGNLKIDPRELEVVLKNNLVGEVEFLKAWRIARGWLPQLKTFIAGLTLSLILGRRMYDSGGTPTVCKKSFISELRDIPTDYVFESFIFFQARQRGVKISRPRIHYGERAFGQSHWQRGIKSELSLMKKIVSSSRRWKN